MKTIRERGYVSPSQITCFRRCRRRYYWRYVRELESRRVSNALRFGHDIHAALGELQDKGLDAGFKLFCSLWDMGLDDEKRNIVVAHRMLENFARSHGEGRGLYRMVDPPVGSRIVAGVSRYELPFAIDIGLPVVLYGVVDGVASLVEGGDLFGLEYKTTSILTSNFINSFRTNAQVAIYTLALRTLGILVRGMIIEGLLVHKEKSETLGLPIHIPQFQDTDTLKWLQVVVSEMLACEDSGVWPKEWTGCHPYNMFGSAIGYVCEYDTLCGIENPESVVDMYAVRAERENVALVPRGAL